MKLEQLRHSVPTVEQLAELREFLSQREDQAPTGFVTRIMNICKHGEPPICSIDELPKMLWGYYPGIGAKTMQHLEYLLCKRGKL